MHMNDGRVVSNFILQALRNEDITVNIFVDFVFYLAPYKFYLILTKHFIFIYRYMDMENRLEVSNT